MQRPVPLHSGSAEFGIGGWRQIAERAVRSDGIVVVEQFVAQSSVEALDEGILLRLALSVACG